MIYSEILKIGIPVLVFQLFASIALGLTNTAAKAYGDYAVAAMGAVSRIMTVGIYVVFGFMKGFQPSAVSGPPAFVFSCRPSVSSCPNS